jgi:hypothetical protein
MLASELIGKLVTLIDAHGDVDVEIEQDGYSVCSSTVEWTYPGYIIIY